MGTAGNAILKDNGAPGLKPNHKPGLFDASGAGCDCCETNCCDDSHPASYTDDFSTDKGWTSSVGSHSVTGGEMVISVANVIFNDIGDARSDNRVSASTQIKGVYAEFEIADVKTRPAVSTWEQVAIFNYRFGFSRGVSSDLVIVNTDSGVQSATWTSPANGDLLRLEVSFGATAVCPDAGTTTATGLLKLNGTTVLSGLAMSNSVSDCCAMQPILECKSFDVGNFENFKYDNVEFGFLL